MNFRTTYILLGIVIVALAALGIYVLRSGDRPTSPTVEGYVLRSLRAADVKPEAVTAVELERAGQTPAKIVFTREGKAWVMTAPAKARTDSTAVEGLVSGLLNARTEKAADLSPNPAAHGLDNPPVKVTLRAGNLSETVSLGNVTIGGDKAVVYVVTSDRPDRPQAVRRSDINALFKPDAPATASHAGQLVKGVTDFRPTRMIGEGLFDPANQVRSLTVRSGKDELALFREPGGAWRFRVPADYGEANADPDPAGPREGGGIGSISQLLNTITSIQPAGRQAIIENPGDLSKYGLDPTKDPALQVDFSRDDGTKETMYVGGPVKAEGQPDKYYARHEADGSIAEVPADPVQKVLAALANKPALRDRTVLKLSPSAVDAIDIVTGGDTIELRKIGAGWQVYDAAGQGRPASRKAVEDLLNRLTAKQLATGFPPANVPEDRRGFATPAAEVRLWVGGIVPDPKAAAGAKPAVKEQPTARLLLGHRDVGDVVFARRATGDQKADFFIPPDAFQLATRGRLDYLDASLKPLTADSVLKLTFTHGKEVFAVERADDGKPAAQAAWKINSPDRLNGRAADPHKIAGLLNELSFLRPIRVVSDKATPDVLNRLEVNPEAPRLRAAVTVKDQGERVYLFGGDVGTEKKSVYLKPGDTEMVFEVDRSAFDELQKADVQDTVVHRIDKAKVRAVKLTGWQEVLGTPTTLEIERKDGKWALKAGGMFELDPAKVDALLDDLTTPRAESFVVYKDGPKPEHNLDPAKNALAVELTLDAGDPVKMVISPPNKEGKVFASSSLSPGDVFVMADRFATLRSRPAALKKD